MALARVNLPLTFLGKQPDSFGPWAVLSIVTWVSRACCNKMPQMEWLKQ